MEREVVYRAVEDRFSSATVERWCGADEMARYHLIRAADILCLLSGLPIDWEA